jgi:hypothetical protein
MSARYRRFGPRLTISLAAADYDRLNALAAEGEVSVSWVVRRAIEGYLAQHPAPRGSKRAGPIPQERHVERPVGR